MSADRSTYRMIYPTEKISELIQENARLRNRIVTLEAMLKDLNDGDMDAANEPEPEDDGEDVSASTDDDEVEF